MFGCGLISGLAINSWRLGKQIESIHRGHAEDEVKRLRELQTDLTYSIDAINRSAMHFAAAKVEYSEAILKLTGKLKDHAKANPLPFNCKPDDYRISVLHDANSAAKQTFKSATGQ